MVLKRIIPVITGILLLASGLWAGDAASFVDMGFSPDGKTYMFAQYGVKADNLKPWADLYIVDVARNDFIPKGRISYTHNEPIYAGQDGSGALYRILINNSSLIERSQI